MRTRTKILIAVIALAVAFAAAGLYAGNYFYTLALSPKTDKSFLFAAEHNTLPFDDAVISQWKADIEWVKTTGYEDWRMDAVDGTPLHAAAMPGDNPSGTWAVLCHGYAGYGLQMAQSARKFHERGFAVLMPDARGFGESGGDFYGMGWPDRLDVKAWIEKINRDHAPKNIILYGVSMGAATVMMTTGEPLPANVRAAVEDCGYSSAYEEFAHQGKMLFGLPSFPVLDFASLVTRIRAGYWLGDADAAKQVAKSVTPILFIHGGDDTFVPASMADALYAAATCEKEKLIFPGVGHAGSATHDPEKYWKAVDAFLHRYVKE